MKLPLTAFLLILYTHSCAQSAQGWDPTPSPSSALLVAQVLVDGLWAPADARIAAFDERGHCVGASDLFSTGTISYAGLRLFGDDPQTLPVEGLTEGGRFSLRLHLPESGQTLTWFGPDGGTLLSGWSDQSGGRLPGFDDPTGVLAFHTRLVPFTCYSPTP